MGIYYIRMLFFAINLCTNNSYINKNAWKLKKKIAPFIIINMTHKIPLRFNRRTMINTEKSKPHKETTRKITNAAMLVLLRRLFRDARTFCAFEIIWEPAEQRHRKRQVIVRNCLANHKLANRLPVQQGNTAIEYFLAFGSTWTDRQIDKHILTVLLN
jgi:hypothetical protein